MQTNLDQKLQAWDLHTNISIWDAPPVTPMCGPEGAAEGKN